MPPITDTDPKTDAPAETKSETTLPATFLEISPAVTEQSQPYIGQWNRLISTTNWDKGEIICRWRTSLEEGEADPVQWSDEAWSRLVGGVTPQHVGRLRRTFVRFGHVYQEYENIYWSHFYAALDWDDAEMWLEGAVQNGWSVSKMRKHRWETLGKIPEDRPDDGEIVTSELAEETQSLDLSEAKRKNDRDVIEGPVYEGPDFGDEPTGDESTGKRNGNEDDAYETVVSENVAAVRPFEAFEDLPDDVLEVVSAFKVAIIRHKTEEWSEVSKEAMLGVLDALKQLVQTPA